MDLEISDLDIQRILNGDKKLLRSFVEVYTPIFRTVVRRIVKGTKDEARIEDLTQDVWVALIETSFRPLAQYSRERGRSLKVFLSKFAYFRILDRLRHERATTKNISLVPPDELARIVLSDSHGRDQQDARDIWASLARSAASVMSEADLKFFMDSFMEDRPVPELAESLGVSAAAIHTRRGRVRKVMVELLYKRILGIDVPDDAEKPG
jgi:RNA polymerase sigma factor (sigma-70 family)